VSMKKSAIALFALSLLAWSVSSEAQESKRKVAFLAASSAIWGDEPDIPD